MDKLKALLAQDFLGKAPLLAGELVKKLSLRGESIASAESCTAGLGAAHIAAIPGASMVLWGSFVCYGVESKHKMLGIPEDAIKAHGPVSRPIALAMAEAALEKSGASWAFSITGLAGPAADAYGSPVGTVWVGIACKKNHIASYAVGFLIEGSRNDVRESAAAIAFNEILKCIEKEK